MRCQLKPKYFQYCNILTVCYFLYVTNDHEGEAVVPSVLLNKDISPPSLPLISLSVVLHLSPIFPKHMITVYTPHNLHKRADFELRFLL